MFDLKINSEKCLYCESLSCLVKCQYLNLDEEQAKEEIKKIINCQFSLVLQECVTCYGCEEYCQYNNHPFYLIVDRQEKLNVLPVPDPLRKRAINLTVPFRGEPDIVEINGPVVNMCVFSHLSPLISGKLFEGLSIISDDPRKMFHFFCQLMYLHYGAHSIIHQRLPKTIEIISKYKPTEVICFHDECYGAYTSYCEAFGIEVKFKVIHMFEYLYTRLLELKDLIKPLGLKAAYQRPCSSRLCPDKHKFVYKIFDLIGVKKVFRKFVDEHSLCCGRTIQGQKMEGRRKLALKLQKENVKDMKEAGAQICVFSCPTCYETLKDRLLEENIQPVYMIDLCKASIGEEPVFWRL